MMIFRVDHGEFLNWAAIMYSQLVKELIRWDKCQKKMIEGTTKREQKKDVCHSAIIVEVLFQKCFHWKKQNHKRRRNMLNNFTRTKEKKRV